jgi:arsenite methyltransferase
MLAKANQIKAKLGKSNVEFVKSSITDMSALESGIADCIISNCVINLVPAAEKHLVFREIFRLLKPGGRLAVSDILAKKPMPEKLRSDMALYVGCISGASTVGEYEGFLKDAGFGGKCTQACNIITGVQPIS